MGREQEFTDWYERAHPRLVVFVAGFCGSHDVGRDVADEVCVRAWERWRDVRGLKSPDAWAYAVAKNEARKRAHRVKRESQHLAVAPGTASPSGSDAMLDLWAALRDLPLRQRQVVVLRDVMDLSESDTADVLDVARGTVSALLHQARSRLRSQLGEQEVLP